MHVHIEQEYTPQLNFIGQMTTHDYELIDDILSMLLDEARDLYQDLLQAKIRLKNTFDLLS